MDDKTKMMRAKFMMNNKALSQESRDAHKAQYRAFGGFDKLSRGIDGLGGITPVDLISGVGNLYQAGQQRKAAREENRQRVGSAQVAGGRKGADAASRNLAQLQQMSPTRGYNPVDTSGGLAAAATEIGNANADLANAEADINSSLVQKGQDFLGGLKEREKKLKEETKGVRQLGDDAAQAYDLVNPASEAIYTKMKIIKNWNEWYRLQASLPYINQGATALDKSMENGIRIEFNAWQQKPEHKVTTEAYGTLEQVVTRLTTGALDALGPGPKTDFDFLVAGRTIADLEGSPTKIKATLAEAVNIANRKLTKAVQPLIPFTKTDDVSDTFVYNDSTIQQFNTDKYETTYPNDFAIGDKFVDSSDVEYEMTAEMVLTQLDDSSIVGNKGDVWQVSDQSLGYDSARKCLILRSFYSTYPLRKVKQEV